MPRALIVSFTVPGAVTVTSRAAAVFTPLPETESTPGPGTVAGTFAVPRLLLFVILPRVNWFEGFTTAETLTLKLPPWGTKSLAELPSRRLPECSS